MKRGEGGAPLLEEPADLSGSRASAGQESGWKASLNARRDALQRGRSGSGKRGVPRSRAAGRSSPGEKGVIGGQKSSLQARHGATCSRRSAARKGSGRHHVVEKEDRLSPITMMECVR